MSTDVILYDHTAKNFGLARIDWEDDTIKLALVTSSYTPSGAHTVWADVSGNEASGTGYSAGGESLSGKSASNDKLDASDVTFSTVTVTFRYGIIYKSGTVDSLTNPLIGYVLFDDTPADVSVSAADYPVVWNSKGVIELAQTAG